MNKDKKESEYWVYVLQSQRKRFGKRGKPLKGFHYVGCTTDPARRLRQHNGEIKGGAKYTACHTPWKIKAIYGPYCGRSEAMKAEYKLKHTKRGVARTQWTKEDSPLCRGLGTEDPRVEIINSILPKESR